MPPQKIEVPKKAKSPKKMEAKVEDIPAKVAKEVKKAVEEELKPKKQLRKKRANKTKPPESKSGE